MNPVRPKICRLPPVAPQRVVTRRHRARQLLYTTVGLIVVAGGIITSIPLINNNSSDHKRVAVLPAISVGAKDAGGDGNGLIGDAQASVGTINRRESGQDAIIALHNHKDYIVGQMAKIPVDSDQITEVKPDIEPDNKVDKSMGRELLSIVNKF